ncbi:MAG: beta-lactamase family protein [Clostridia bacterium]|nr:beta-lactamase family protein [Clostridia bacterium]
MMKGFGELDRYLGGLAENGVPGCELSVFFHGENVFRECYGHDDEFLERKTSRETMYMLYSMTKVFTSFAAMKLVEEGKLGLDDPVAKYLPEYGKLTVSDGGVIRPARETLTVRHLMSMQGGFDYDTSFPGIVKANEEAGGHGSTRELICALAGKPLSFDPGTDYQYSLCHDILAAVIEEVAGERFARYMARTLFGPLGLTSMRYHPGETEDPGRIGYMWATGGVDGRTLKTDFMSNVRGVIMSDKYDSGGAGLFGTCDDYAKFADAVVRGELIGRRTIALWHTNQLSGKSLATYRREKPEYGYALGVRIFTDESRPALMNEFGWDGAAGSYVMMDEKNEIAAVYTQSVHGCGVAFREIHPAIRDCVYKTLLGAD